MLVYCDGSALGNPGPAGIGVVVTCEKSQIQLPSLSKPIRACSSIGAEYTAVLYAVRHVLSMKEHLLTYPQKVLIRSDCQDVVGTLQGNYPVTPSMGSLHRQIILESAELGRVMFECVHRSRNKAAHNLAGQASRTALEPSNAHLRKVGVAAARRRLFESLRVLGEHGSLTPMQVCYLKHTVESYGVKLGG